MRYVGGDFVVDVDAFTVVHDGASVDLEPQAMDLLLHMLARREQLLTKEELLDEVWGDQFVGESALTTRIKQLRRALGDDGRTQRVIRTVHGKGYRFVAPVEEVADDGVPADDRSTEDHTGGATPADGPGAATAVAHNIPPLRTRLIGRASLLDDVGAAVSESRLVTLVGFGGAGKTSVATEVGRTSTASFADGIWFVDLISVHDADAIDRAVARSVGAQLGATDRTAVLDHLSRRRVLLVLDNCEHVADAAAEFCSELLDTTTAPHVLATSRVPLHVLGEHRIAVEPLPVIDEMGGALDLLDDVASRFGATIPASDRIAALELCHRVDGLPLAIELVGARLATMSVHEILDRLTQLEALPTSERRHERHAALATVLGDTVDTLDPDEVRLLTLLGRVEGSFGIDEVEGVGRAGGVTAPGDRFAALVDRSLLVRTSSSPRRHAVLETVRQHVAAHDPDPVATADCHADWCLAAVGTSLRAHFYGLPHADWVAERFEDLNVAHDHLASVGRTTDAVRLLSSMALAMHLDDGSRATAFLRRLDAHPTLDDTSLTTRRHCAGVMAAMAARSPTGMLEHGQAAVAAADQGDDPALQALARVMRSWSGVVIDVEQAATDLAEAVDLAARAGDHETGLIATGYTVFHLAMTLRFDEAVDVGRRALERAPLDDTSYPRRVAATGLVCCLVVDDPRESIRLDADVRTAMSVTFWGTNIVRATAHASLGDIDHVAESVRSLEERLERTGVSPLPDLLLVPAALALSLGDLDRAGRCLGAVRTADRPTQSLMVSTAYRALRNHVPVVASESTTAEVWDEARSWIRELADASR